MEAPTRAQGLIRAPAAGLVRHGPVQASTQGPGREAARAGAGDCPLPVPPLVEALCAGATAD
jgi:hypothetical protein